MVNRILVTGARTYYSLPVIRWLGRRGCHVTAADSDPHASGFYSRYTRARWIHPRIDLDSRAWFEALKPGRDYWRRLRLALSLLVPKSSSASDFFSFDDLPSLRALPIAAVDACRTLRRGRWLDTVASSQYREY
jgi:hypothetical protein